MTADGEDLKEYCLTYQWNGNWTNSTKAYYCKICLSNLKGLPCKHPDCYIGNVEAIKPKVIEMNPDSDREIEE